jgi:hypothetical protein
MIVQAPSPWCTFIPSLLPLNPLAKSKRVAEKPLPTLGRDDPAMEVAIPPPQLGWTQHSVNDRPAWLQFHQRPSLKPQCTQCVSYSTTHHLRVLRRPRRNNGATMSICSSSRPSTRLLLGGIANHQSGTRAHLKHHGYHVTHPQCIPCRRPSHHQWPEHRQLHMHRWDHRCRIQASQ